MRVRILSTHFITAASGVSIVGCEFNAEWTSTKHDNCIVDGHQLYDIAPQSFFDDAQVYVFFNFEFEVIA